jgi:hypothetical protein
MTVLSSFWLHKIHLQLSQNAIKFNGLISFITISDGVIWISHSRNPSDCTMALSSTQPLTETSSWNKGKGGQCSGLTTLQSSFVDHLEILGGSTPWNPKGLSRLVMGLLYFHKLCKIVVFYNANISPAIQLPVYTGKEHLVGNRLCKRNLSLEA